VPDPFSRVLDWQLSELGKARHSIANPDSSRDPMKDFELLFTQLHGGFNEKLVAINPELTRIELQICALLRLNLSSKDIARLTNISLSTVEMTRHHIRQKLNLDQKISLTSHLISI
jgi:DNA-binding NarL/FixJ family response regulator